MLALPDKIKSAIFDRYKKVSVDKESFMRFYIPCTLEKCEGMCCYDGVILLDEEAAFLASFFDRKGDELKKLGFDIPYNFLQSESELSIKHKKLLKTKVLPVEYKNPDFPLSFTKTRCIFSDSGARCALQMLAVQEGLHPWHYKPFSCWLHPVSLIKESKPYIGVPDKGERGHTAEEYDDFTYKTACGRNYKEQVHGSVPGHEAFKEELTVLSELTGRNLIAEILQKY